MIFLNFDLDICPIENCEMHGLSVDYLAFREIVYVKRPICPEYQRMNIFIPAAYRNGGAVNGYTRETAPIFMPNTVGGYMPGPLDEPGLAKFGPKVPNAIFHALRRGYVVAAPALCGRTLQNKEGAYVGKAPACIVDYKAAVRFLRGLGDALPGDKEKIITNGTSAGGALSSLMGATGNAAEYEPYLQEIGAADERDDIFAASCYCPITNLEHADMAYEWQFAGINEYHGVRPPDFAPVEGPLTQEQERLSKELARSFPAYVNSLGLIGPDGGTLSLDGDGKGSFLDYIQSRVLDSAQRALDRGEDLADQAWLSIQGGKALDMDFAAYAKAVTRMKTPPAFDSENSPETDLFGSAELNCRHFTDFGQKNFGGAMAEPAVIALMSPMTYLRPGRQSVARHWRIRHGERDRDTSLAVSAILSLTLRSLGCGVDYRLPWDTPHSGDYDLEELFDWIDSLCREQP